MCLVTSYTSLEKQKVVSLSVVKHEYGVKILARKTGGEMQVKKERKRIEILKAALELFNEQPFEEVTTSMIANAAHVGKGTLYTYFKNKNQIFESGFALLTDEFVESTKKVRLCECGVSEKIDMLFEAYYEVSSKRRKIWYVFMKLYVDDRFSEKRLEFQRNLKSEISGIFKPFEKQLAIPLKDMVSFVMVNVMPFGMRHYAHNEEYWKSVAKVIKRGTLLQNDI